MTLYDKFLCAVLVTYIFVEFNDMHNMLNDPKYTTLDLIKEAISKAVWVGLFIALYIDIVINGGITGLNL